MRRSDREISDIAEIESIIGKADVCRIAIANDDYPYIVTLNFGYSGSPRKEIYFHCAPEGKKLDMIRKNNFVCFQMDADHLLTRAKLSCDWGMGYSSVTGYGRIHFVDNIEEKTFGLNCIMKHYGRMNQYNYDEKTFARTVVLRLDIEEISGKKK